VLDLHFWEQVLYSLIKNLIYLLCSCSVSPDVSDFAALEKEIRDLSDKENGEHIELDTYIVGGYQ